MENLTQFMIEKKFPNNLIRNGPALIVSIWSSVYDNILAEKDSWTYYEYLDDIDYRNFFYLLEREKQLESSISSYKSEIHRIDKLILPRLQTQSNCIYKSDFEKRNSINSNEQWWYYSWPKFAIHKKLIPKNYNI